MELTVTKCLYRWTNRQPMPLQKRANVTTEMVRVLSTVYEGYGRNTALQTSKAGARCASIRPSLKFAREKNKTLTHS